MRPKRCPSGQVLQGYEKAVGLKNVARYRPALSTIWNLCNLFVAQGQPNEAKEMYSRACTGFQDLLGPSSNECQQLEHSIASLDATQGKWRDFYLVCSDVIGLAWSWILPSIQSSVED
jgi:hypothetical protein